MKESSFCRFERVFIYFAVHSLEAPTVHKRCVQQRCHGDESSFLFVCGSVSGVDPSGTVQELFVCFFQLLYVNSWLFVPMVCQVKKYNLFSTVRCCTSLLWDVGDQSFS